MPNVAGSLPLGLADEARPSTNLHRERRQLLLHGHVLQRDVLRQTILAIGRWCFAADQRREVLARGGRDVEAILRDERAWQLLFTVGDLVELRGFDLPAVR